VDDLARERGGALVHDAAAGEWSFTYDLQLGDGATACTQHREVHYVDADGVQQRIQLAVDAGFAGAALFALGYEDEAVWGAVDTVNAALDPIDTTVPAS
jgi:hypothetical protein